MSEVKKEVKKQALTKRELLEFNNIWGLTKVKCSNLSPELIKEYLYLKIKMSEHAKAITGQIEEAKKVVLAEIGYKVGDKLSEAEDYEAGMKINAALDKVYSEVIELNTHIMPFDEFVKCLLNIEENNSINTEGKAILMKHLLKE